MGTEPTGYRFLDSHVEAFADGAPEVIYSVEFNPSIEDYVYVTSLRTKSRVKITQWTKFTLQAFYLINSIGLPAVLFFFGHPILAIAFFALNILFATFFLPATLKTDYRRYYRSIFGDDFEKETVKIELTPDGVYCRQQDDASYHDWKSVLSVEETTQSIYLHLRGSSIIVRKSGFLFDDQKNQFLAFVREHVKKSQTRQLSQ